MSSTFNILADQPLTRGTAEDHFLAFVTTRMEEVALQALPQGFFQSLVVLRMVAAGDKVSWVQWASIGGALLSVCFIGKTIDVIMCELSYNKCFGMNSTTTLLITSPHALT